MNLWKTFPLNMFSYYPVFINIWPQSINILSFLMEAIHESLKTVADSWSVQKSFHKCECSIRAPKNLKILTVA